MVCFVFTTGYSGGRQSPSVLFLSSSFLSAPHSFHCLFHCPSLSASPERSVNLQPSDSFLSFVISHSTMDTVEPTSSSPCINSTICRSTWVIFNKIMLWVHTQCSVVNQLLNCSKVINLVHLPVWYKTSKIILGKPRHRQTITSTRMHIQKPFRPIGYDNVLLAN